MAEENEARPLALDPTWSIATVMLIFVAVSLLVERSIHRLGSWLRETNRKPLFEALEKMKEELMLLGLISLLLTASSRTIASICINAKFYVGKFSPCTKAELEVEDTESLSEHNTKKLMHFVHRQSFRRLSDGLDEDTCKEGYEPFVSYEGLEQLHRFIFIMALTHLSYSCLTMLLAIIKIHTWRAWEDEAHNDKHEAFCETPAREAASRQSNIVKFHASNPLGSSRYIVWLICFFRQFGQSVVRVDYLALRMGFIMNHNLPLKFDFHSYMVRSMEEEFRRIVGVSAPLWGFVVVFMLFDIEGTNLYFWLAIIPITLVLVLGTKLQHIIATLAWENAGITGFFRGTKLKPRDELFWFKRPKLVLSLIHFVLFQNSFELASFFWYWWQFGYNSCFIRNHLLVYLRLILGFLGQLLCSYSTLPLYALVTQMGTNYKAALIPENVRETLQGWKKTAKRKRKLGVYSDDSTPRTETTNRSSFGELYRTPSTSTHSEIELPTLIVTTSEGGLSRVGTPLLRSSISSTGSPCVQEEKRVDRIC